MLPLTLLTCSLLASTRTEEATPSCGNAVPVVNYDGQRFCWGVFVPLVFPAKTQYCMRGPGQQRVCTSVTFASVYQRPDLLGTKWTGPVFSRDVLVIMLGVMASLSVVFVTVLGIYQRCKAVPRRLGPALAWQE